MGRRQQTFTAYFEDAGFDERPYAEAVVAKTGAEAHWISFTDAQLVDVLPLVVEAQGEPFGSTSIVAQWHVMRAARSAGVTVMLDGQGGDEISLVYPTHLHPIFSPTCSPRDDSATRRARSRRIPPLSRADLGAPIAQVVIPPLFLPRDVVLARLRGRPRGAHALVGSPSRFKTSIPHESERTSTNLPDRLRRQSTG